MNNAANIQSVIFEAPNLPDQRIREISGALANKLYTDDPVPPDMRGDFVRESEILINIRPEKPIIKMIKKEHADAFFRDGTLRLGTFMDFSKSDQKAIGDASEGSFILVGCAPTRTGFVALTGGFNHYVFCCSIGPVDRACLKSFGYDAAFEICDIDGFVSAVDESINAKRKTYARCVYRKDKIVLGMVSKDFPFNILSPRLLEMANVAKYFVKPVDYSYQSEFRLLWEMQDDVSDPMVIKCPKAVDFCRPMDISV